MLSVSERIAPKAIVLLQIFTETFEMLGQLAEEMEGEQGMLPLATMGLMMVDWLDPFKVV